jgi:hypothetical protein
MEYQQSRGTRGFPFDEEFIAEEFGPPPPAAAAKWRRAKKKLGRAVRIVHVVPSGKRGWSVMTREATLTVAHFKTRTAALHFARKAAKSKDVELVVHTEGGSLGG